MDVHPLLVLGQHEPPKVPNQSGSDAPPPGGVIEGAHGGQQGPPGGGGDPQGRPEGAFNPFFMIILVLGVFMIFMMGGQRKEKKKRAQMLAGLKKGDKVQTVGGILGTVVEIRETEIVLKVDENANTRIKFSRSAMQSVVAERPEQE